jgi:hypothetical protein
VFTRIGEELSIPTLFRGSPVVTLERVAPITGVEKVEILQSQAREQSLRPVMVYAEILGSS